jgi:tRNA uridine 5-carbamoylmethylation protein Kti12
MDNQILEIKKTGAKKIVIIGLPASGKTWLSNKLAAKLNLPVYHADDYLNHGFENSMYAMHEDMERNNPEAHIIEGVAAYRLLRKAAQGVLNYSPDLIIMVNRAEDVRRSVYENERNNPFRSIAGMQKTLDKILNEYLAIRKVQVPIINFNNI